MMNALGVLAELAPDARDALFAAGRVIDRPAREFLMCQGERSDSVFLLEHGLAEVRVTDADGSTMFVTFRAAGSLLGEFGVLGRTTRSATVTALTSVRCRVWGAASVREFLRRRPEAYAPFARCLVDKTVGAMLRQQHYGHGEPGTRIARVLYDFAAVHGRSTPDGVVIDLPLSHQRIGDLAHLSRHTVAVHLRAWADDRIVTTGYRGRRRMQVLDAAGLGERAEIGDRVVDPLRPAC